MKIALVIQHFDPRRGGAERWTAEFATQLLARGHEVHVVAERFGEQVGVMGVVAHRVDGGRSRIDFAAAAQASLLALGPDVIHDMGAGWYCDVFQPHGGSTAALYRQKLKTVSFWLRPIKRRVDAMLPRYGQFQTLLARQYVDDGRLLIALSRSVADDFQRFHGVPPERIRLVYNGVDVEHFSPRHRARYREAIRRQLAVGDDTLLVLIVAHNFRLKGVPSLLRVVRQLNRQRRPVHLAVVGGKRLRGWRWAARRLGIRRQVTFVGSIGDARPYYAAADVYAHPTFYDPCSLVVLEALASGLPVITTSRNGAGELMTDGVEGYVLSDPADLDGLRGRIEMLRDADVRRRMGQSARRLALEHPLAGNVDEVLAVYDEAMANRPGGAFDPLLRGLQSTGRDKVLHPSSVPADSPGGRRRSLIEKARG